MLAGRIAALNMLGLTLDHLGVMTSLPDGGRNEAVWNGLEALAKVVGDGACALFPAPSRSAADFRLPLHLLAQSFKRLGLRTTSLLKQRRRCWWLRTNWSSRV